MRSALFVMAVIGALFVTGESRAQSAYDYPICAYYQDKTGATACYYSTYEQCRATMSGIGGYCAPNPAYRGRPAAATTGRAPAKHRGRAQDY